MGLVFSPVDSSTALELCEIIHSTMGIRTVNVYYWAVLLLLLTTGESLRCRSGNQQSNDRIQRIMQACRKKYSSHGNKNNDDYATWSENDSSDEHSALSVNLDEDFFFADSNKRSNGNNSRNGGSNDQSSNRNYGENQRHKNDSYMNNRTLNRTNYTWANERNGMSNRDENRTYRNGMQSQNSEDNNNHRDRIECIIQCFFEELNVVDQRGFPQRDYVTETMTRGIQDPSVRDFIEESIFECFYYLESDSNNHEKCTFADNLMKCYVDKGRDRCEDWNDV